MEKIKSALGILGSFIIIIIQVLVFSCEEKKSASIIEEKKGDTIRSITRKTDADFISDSGYTKKFRSESQDLEIQLKALGEKAKKKGGEIGNSVKENISKLESQRSIFQKDSTSIKQKNVQADWEKFKQKTRAAIDSLEKKLND